MADYKYDRDAEISNVRFSDPGAARFTAQNLDWIYMVGRGRLYANHAGEPVHQSDDGSYCITPGHSFGEVMSNAHLLGASVYRART